MPTFQLDADETIIKQEPAMHLKSAINAQRGQLYVTTKRILFLKATNVIQQMIGSNFIVCNILRSDMNGVTQGKYGVNTNVLNVTIRDGTSYRFLVDSYPAWAEILH